MREIKFRAWDHEKNIYGYVTLIEWYIGEHEEAKNYGHKGRVSLWNPKNLDDCGSWGRWIERVDLEQFTGLRDKNGVEIYENDIVQFRNGGKVVSDVVHYEGSGFYVGQWCPGELTDFADECTVIGNIHEKPEDGR